MYSCPHNVLFRPPPPKKKKKKKIIPKRGNTACGERQRFAPFRSFSSTCMDKDDMATTDSVRKNKELPWKGPNLIIPYQTYWLGQTTWTPDTEICQYCGLSRLVFDPSQIFTSSTNGPAEFLGSVDENAAVLGSPESLYTGLLYTKKLIIAHPSLCDNCQYVVWYLG